MKKAAVISIALFVVIFAIGATRHAPPRVAAAAPEVTPDPAPASIDVYVKRFGNGVSYKAVHGTVSIGMSGAEVEAAIGRDHVTTRDTLETGTIEYWRYFAGDSDLDHPKYVTLMLRDGILRAVSQR